MTFQASGSRVGYDGKSRPVFTYQDALNAYDSGASWNQVNDWLSEQQYEDNLRPIDSSGQTWDSMIKPTYEQHRDYNAREVPQGGTPLPDAYEVHGVRGYQDPDAAHFLAGWQGNEYTAAHPEQNAPGADVRDQWWDPSKQAYGHEVYRGGTAAGGTATGSTATGGSSSGSSAMGSTAAGNGGDAGSFGQKPSSGEYKPNFTTDTSRIYSDSDVRTTRNAYERTTETGGDRPTAGGFSYRWGGGDAPGASGEHRQDDRGAEEREDSSFSSRWRKYTASGQPLAGSMFGAFS